MLADGMLADGILAVPCVGRKESESKGLFEEGGRVATAQAAHGRVKPES